MSSNFHSYSNKYVSPHPFYLLPPTTHWQPPKQTVPNHPPTPPQIVPAKKPLLDRLRDYVLSLPSASIPATIDRIKILESLGYSLVGVCRELGMEISDKDLAIYDNLNPHLPRRVQSYNSTNSVPNKDLNPVPVRPEPQSQSGIQTLQTIPSSNSLSSTLPPLQLPQLPEKETDIPILSVESETSDLPVTNDKLLIVDLNNSKKNVERKKGSVVINSAGKSSKLLPGVLDHRNLSVL
ncbi:hypothetical protein HK098_001901 [Nowakowskiella sp. JEL0407]|nr:hypothetical protein HK098_001901 [Nowakowskiella sp. JEL0407]